MSKCANSFPETGGNWSVVEEAFTEGLSATGDWLH